MTYSYSYVVLQHVPDPGAGEALNVGVIVFSRQARFLKLRADSRYERLSQAFARFDGVSFRSAIANLHLVFKKADRTLNDRPLFDNDRTFADWLTALVPDIGASISFSAPRHGLASSLENEVDLLFERMVESQKGMTIEPPRRDDEQVWKTCAPHLADRVKRSLRPTSFNTPTVKVAFEHAVKNGRWHVIQPLSMDFRRAESMQRKASEWVGTSVGLGQAPDFGTILFVLGKPTAGHSKAYLRARALLAQTPTGHEIIDEHDTARLNRRLLDLLDHREE
jgi:hypothetical protein